jgi:hypothetical protein
MFIFFLQFWLHAYIRSFNNQYFWKMYNRVPWDKKTETGFMILKYFFSFCLYYYFFLRLWTRQETLYLYIFIIYICIIASNDNNQCMQFVCPYCGPIDWNNKYSYSYSILYIYSSIIFIFLLSTKNLFYALTRGWIIL